MLTIHRNWSVTVQLSFYLTVGIFQLFAANTLALSSTIRMPTTRIKVNIVCDRNFSKIFWFNEQLIGKYWKQQIQDLDVRFQTLPSFDLIFQIGSIAFFEDQDQNLVEDFKDAKGRTWLTRLNAAFPYSAFRASFPMEAFTITLLVIGSMGHQYEANVESSTTCQLNYFGNNGTTEKYVVVRASVADWYTSSELATAFAEILGDDFTDISCRGEGCLLENEIRNSYYFSACEDSRLRMYASNSSFWLEKRPAESTTRTKETDLTFMEPDEMCRLLRYNNPRVWSDKVDCKQTECVDLFTREIVGYIEPLYNTMWPWERNICIRGRCEPAGNHVVSYDSGLCLEINTFVRATNVTLSECRSGSFQSQNFVILNVSNDGVLLTARPANPNNSKICLTVVTHAARVITKSCAEKNDTFVWNLIQHGNKSTFFIQHQLTGLYLGTTRNKIVLSNIRYTDNTFLWNIVKVEGVSKPEDETDPNFSSHTGIVVAVLCVFVVSGVGLFILYWYKYRRNGHRHYRSRRLFDDEFYEGAIQHINPGLSLSDQADLLPFDPRWEFNDENLKLGIQLGAGAFGCVFKGVAYGIIRDEMKTEVAVKTTKKGSDETEFKALTSELKILGNLAAHVNIVNLLGACTKGRNLRIVLEFCKFGNIRGYILRHRSSFINEVTFGHGTVEKENIDSNGASSKGSSNSAPDYKGDYHELDATPFTTSDLTLWAFQIAIGMEYLSQKRILHGDLAARNILLSEKNIVKICDFGLSKKLTRNYAYNYKKEIQGALLPFKWMAIESIQCGLFSTESDCWSYGIVLWEMYSLGQTPYSGLQMDEALIDRINQGYRMEKPLNAPSLLYDIMLQCWSENPLARPTFPGLVEKLMKMIDNQKLAHYTKVADDYNRLLCSRGKPTVDYVMNKYVFKFPLQEDNDGYLMANSV